MMNGEKDQVMQVEGGLEADDSGDGDPEYRLYENWCSALSQAGPAAPAPPSLGRRHLFQYATSRGVTFVPVSSSHVLGVVATTAAPSRRSIKSR
jgi:hypothetical protein